MSLQNRLLIIGLDGATFDLILPWVESEKLPTFRRLLQAGTAAPLRSVIHPYTAQAWTTMVTGQNAGAHRIFDFWERDFTTHGFKLLNASMRAVPALWNILSQRNQPVIVINVPMSYPPEPVNGIMVSGRDTPGLDSTYTFPPTIKDELEQVLGRRYVIVPNDWLYAEREEFTKVREVLLDEIDVRVTTALHLMQTRDWRFCMFVISATDGATHFLWRFHDKTFPSYNPTTDPLLSDALFHIYRRVDDRLAELLEDLPADVAVVMVSDHGGGASTNAVIHLNLWLAEQGLLTFHPASKKSTGAWAKAQIVYMLEALKKQVYKRVSFQNLTKLRHLWPDPLRSRLGNTAMLNIDWAKTRAFSEERRGNIWINVKGRDPQGIVKPGEEYEAIRNQIVETLTGLANPLTGERLIKHVWRREELFGGSFLKKLPDLIIEAENPDIFHCRDHNAEGKSVRQLTPFEMRASKISGEHRYNGIFVATGQGIRKGVWLEEIDMVDVAPTLLYMLDEAIPAEMDGQIITPMFEEDYLQAHSPRRSDAIDSDSFFQNQESTDYSSEETRAIEKRLSGLGYMD